VIDYDRIALEYSSHRRVHPEVFRHLLDESEISSRSRVLEVGCGTGNYILAIESALGCSCWGTDPSAEMLAKARPGKVCFQMSRAERLPFLPACFDLVFSVDVIHHLDDRSTCYREGWRVLKPGGRMCTVTDSEWIIRHREPLAVYFPETVEADLARYPGLADLRKAMERAGFEQIWEHMVEFSYLLRDAQAYRDRAFSSLHLIGEEAWRRGLQRLQRDLRSGPIPCCSRYVLVWALKEPAQNRAQECAFFHPL
jgi:ubiquinone/menaquinone biosynthesis C-methylase UbiE